MEKPIVIAGPCMAESLDVMEQVAEKLRPLSDELGFQWIFKASFDKANRTSGQSKRGPGLEKALEWFETVKRKFQCQILTDVHETHQVRDVAGTVDILQIPAFLCRQTDLVVAAAESGKIVNIKKGQFLSPEAMGHILNKTKTGKDDHNPPPNIWVTERGVTFGYENLVVDMRSFPIMAQFKAPILFDITHSTQIPAGKGGTSSAKRSMAPTLARSATATGYLSGYFLEVHPEPAKASSDKDAQLSLDQAEILLRQLVPLWRQSRTWSSIDVSFTDSL